MGFLMLNEFFINSCVLCTLLFLIYQLYRKFPVTPRSSLVRRVVAGVIQGVFGMLLMHYGIHLQSNVLVDLRIIPMMVAAYVGGWVTSVVASILILAARLLFYPLSMAAILNVFILLGCGIMFAVIASRPIKRRTQWRLMTAFFLAVTGVTLWMVLRDFKTTLTIFVQYAIAVVYGAYLGQFVLSFFVRSADHLDKLNQQAQTDFLTGLQNARSFSHEIVDRFQTGQERQEPLSLLLIDIDHFKRVNDTYGHPIGDEVLKQLGRVLTENCREMDVVSRNGGEEFSVILPACDAEFAWMVAERIRKTVERKGFAIDAKTRVPLTVSIGAATVTDYENTSWKELIHVADQRLYQAKRAGRNRTCTEEEAEG